MRPTLIYLSPICSQLTEALGLSDGDKVAALIDEYHKHDVLAWCIVHQSPDGSIARKDNVEFKTIKELLNKKENDV